MLMAVDSRGSGELLEVVAQLPMIAAVDLNRIAKDTTGRFRIDVQSFLQLLRPIHRSNDH